MERGRCQTLHAGGHRRSRQDAECKATSIRASDGKPLGSYRWLVWAVFPINNFENTAYQELQVIPAEVGKQ